MSPSPPGQGEIVANTSRYRTTHCFARRLLLFVKYVDTPENSDPIFAFVKKPVGHFIFTAGGHVAFSIMRNRNSVWVTHVLSANIPGFLSTDQPRHFKIDGNRHVVAETYLNGSTRIRAERIFIRETVPRERPLNSDSRVK